MKNYNCLNGFLFFLFSIFILSCSKKSHPVKSETDKVEVVTPAPKPAPKRITKTPAPRFIVIDDKVAKKDVDGRMYYDLEGKRYWKNFRDGKYYLFNKSMYDNYDFKPRKQ